MKSKYDSDQEEESQYEHDEDDALIKTFKKFLRKEKTKEISKKQASTSRYKVTYFECGTEVMSKVSALILKGRPKSITRRIGNQKELTCHGKTMR